jgi:hypothetical protein
MGANGPARVAGIAGLITPGESFLAIRGLLYAQLSHTRLDSHTPIQGIGRCKGGRDSAGPSFASPGNQGPRTAMLTIPPHTNEGIARPRSETEVAGEQVQPLSVQGSCFSSCRPLRGECVVTSLWSPGLRSSAGAKQRPRSPARSLPAPRSAARSPLQKPRRSRCRTPPLPQRWRARSCCLRR